MTAPFSVPVPDRRKILLAKFIALYLSGIFSLTLLFTLFAIGAGIMPWGLLIQSVLGLAIGSFVTYALHLFLSLKFGLGISLFWGVFECLQCILYSNIELHGLWRFIPFSWSVNWVHDVHIVIQLLIPCVKHLDNTGCCPEPLLISR